MQLQRFKEKKRCGEKANLKNAARRKKKKKKNSEPDVVDPF